MKAMLLAAGLGTRMRPLTDAIPKPTLPALDRPMIRRLIDQLADHGIESAVVNSHAHPELLAEALRGAAIPVEHVFEAELRGSGGGIAGARALLEDATFLVLNADMVLDLRLPDCQGLESILPPCSQDKVAAFRRKETGKGGANAG